MFGSFIDEYFQDDNFNPSRTLSRKSIERPRTPNIDINSIQNNTTFTPVDIKTLPQNSNILGSRFVFRTKRDQQGNITKQRGRLVAQEFNQRPGINFNETFTPVAKFTSIRILVALSAAFGLHIHQADNDKANYMVC